MRVREIGNAGPCVVKLAGLAGGVGLYEEHMRAVAEAGFRVVAVDTSGDRSDDPAPGPLGWDRFASEIGSALDRVGVEKAILWGTSFGSLVALGAAARIPHRISGLLLCHPPDPAERPSFQKFLLGRVERSRDPARAARRLFVFGFRCLTSWELVCPPLLFRLPSLYRANLEAATPASTILAKMRLLASEPPGLPPPSIPIAILAGAFDLVAPVREARSLAARLPGARLVVLGFSGHAGAFARPRAYGKLVVRELRELARASRSAAS